jgi:hypothetical protein
MRLVAPFYTDLSQWRDVPVYDIHADNPARMHVTTSSREWTDGPMWEVPTDGDVIQVQSYADIVRDYVNHPEAKYDDANGNPCTGRTRGRLYPTTVVAECYDHVGKSSHQRLSADATFVKGSRYRLYDSDSESRILDTTRLILNENYTVNELLRELENQGVKISRMTLYNFKRGATDLANSPKGVLISMAKQIARKDLEPIEAAIRKRIQDGQLLAMWRHSKEAGSI